MSVGSFVFIASVRRLCGELDHCRTDYLCTRRFNLNFRVQQKIKCNLFKNVLKSIQWLVLCMYLKFISRDMPSVHGPHY